MTTIDRWAVVADPFAAPEVHCIRLVGTVTGHPKKPDGTVVRTSPVMTVDGRCCTTATGTVYRLGDPSPGYRAWLFENRPLWDPANPITMV